MRSTFSLFLMAFLTTLYYPSFGQQPGTQTHHSTTVIPTVYSNIHADENGKLYVLYEDQRFYKEETAPAYELDKITGSPTGGTNGLFFDFQNPDFEGKLIYGLIPYGDSKHPYPVYFYASEKLTTVNVL